MLIKTKFKSKKPWREFQRQNSSKQSMVKPPLMTSLMTSMDSWVPVLQRSKKMKPKVRTSETRQQSEGRSSWISIRKETTLMRQVQMRVLILQTASSLNVKKKRIRSTWGRLQTVEIQSLWSKNWTQLRPHNQLLQANKQLKLRSKLKRRHLISKQLSELSWRLTSYNSLIMYS